MKIENDLLTVKNMKAFPAQKVKFSIREFCSKCNHPAEFGVIY